MHVFMESREAKEVRFVRAFAEPRQTLDYRLQDCTEVRQRGVSRRQREVPPCSVWNVARVVEVVAQLPSQLSLVPEYPVLLEPADVSQFPQQWVDGHQPGTHPLLVIQVLNERQRALARIEKPFL